MCSHQFMEEMHRVECEGVGKGAGSFRPAQHDNVFTAPETICTALSRGFRGEVSLHRCD